MEFPDIILSDDRKNLGFEKLTKDKNEKQENAHHGDDNKEDDKSNVKNDEKPRWRRITIKGIIYDGYLKITDKEKFKKAFISGIGPAKAFGYGLLSIAAPTTYIDEINVHEFPE